METWSELNFPIEVSHKLQIADNQCQNGVVLFENFLCHLLIHEFCLNDSNMSHIAGQHRTLNFSSLHQKCNMTFHCCKFPENLCNLNSIKRVCEEFSNCIRSVEAQQTVRKWQTDLLWVWANAFKWKFNEQNSLAWRNQTYRKENWNKQKTLPFQFLA